MHTFLRRQAQAAGPAHGGRDEPDGPRPGPVIDPDVDLRDPRQESVSWRGERAVVAVIALGGVLGAEARYGVGAVVPRVPGLFPLPTWLINMTGCLLIGVLMVIVAELRTGHRLVRPFFGVGVLGGFTTFSGFAQDVQNLIRTGHPFTALAYWLLTLTGGWAAAWAGMAVTRRLARCQESAQ